jgi:hypothetical protein
VALRGGAMPSRHAPYEASPAAAAVDIFLQPLPLLAAQRYSPAVPAGVSPFLT